MKREGLKNYVIGTLIVAVMVLVSIIYKNSRTLGIPFPVHDDAKLRAAKVEIPLYLYVFFSKQNCHDCLEVLQVLNDLPPHFIVTGVVPDNELKNEKELRAITGAIFPLTSISKIGKNHLPWYSPTIVGVSPNGKIIVSLPGVPREKEYLKTFLESLYGKTFPIFLDEKVRTSK